VTTIEGVALFALAVLTIGGALQHEFNVIPILCAIPFVVMLARRPRIDANGNLRTRVTFIPYFRRVPLAAVVGFELVTPRSREWTVMGNYGVRARLSDGSSVPIQESSSFRSTGASEWLTALNGLIDRAPGESAASQRRA
jgi:hypothetical protein